MKFSSPPCPLSNPPPHHPSLRQDDVEYYNNLPGQAPPNNSDRGRSSINLIDLRTELPGARGGEAEYRNNQVQDQVPPRSIRCLFLRRGSPWRRDSLPCDSHSSLDSLAPWAARQGCFQDRDVEARASLVGDLAWVQVLLSVCRGIERVTRNSSPHRSG